MRLLVRHRLRRTRREGYVERSEILEAEEISVGRGSDAVLHLSDGRVLLHHATIALQNGVLCVTAEPNADIELNGVPTKVAELSTGHTVTVGPYDLVCGDAHPECDAAVEIELARPMGDAETTLRDRVRTPLLKRRLSGWKIGGAIALVLLMVGLSVPLSSFLVTRDTPKPAPALVNATVSNDSDIFRMAETMWVTERLSDVHGKLEAGCQACHTTAFAAVADNTCVDCHNTLTAHVDPHASFSANVDQSGGCATCHQEHTGPKGIHPGVQVTETGCIACHNGNIDPGDGSALARVASIADHPPMTLPTPSPNGLVFSHASHLAPQGKRRPDGKRQVLGCVDCHQSANAARDMTMPSFKNGCASCHTMAFAAEDPSQRLPHGPVSQLRSFLLGFYEAVERGEIVAPELAVPTRRRRPGQSAEPVAATPPAPLPARTRTEQALSGPAVKGQCATCHALEESVTPAEWDIANVDFVHDWLSSARFDHKDHLKDAKCGTCHAVGKSEKATDVAMPSMGTCLECHGSADDSPDVASTCVTCHAFHGSTQQGAGLERHPAFAQDKPDQPNFTHLADLLREGKL